MAIIEAHIHKAILDSTVPIRITKYNTAGRHVNWYKTVRKCLLGATDTSYSAYTLRWRPNRNGNKTIGKTVCRSKADPARDANPRSVEYSHKGCCRSGHGRATTRRT